MEVEAINALIASMRDGDDTARLEAFSQIPLVAGALVTRAPFRLPSVST